MRYLPVLALFLFLILPVQAAKSSKKDETSEEPPVTYAMLATYADSVLKAGAKGNKPENEYSGQKFDSFRHKLFYVNKSSGTCYYLFKKNGWNFLIEFVPEKSYKVGSMLAVNGVIEKITVYDKDVQGDKTVHLVLDTSGKKAVTGRSASTYKYSVDDMARIGDDVYSLPMSMREILPMPADAQLKNLTDTVYSTNKETRAVNLRNDIGGWQITLKLKAVERVAQKSLIRVKNAVINDISIYRQSALRTGRITVDCDGGDISIIKDASKDDD